jgi:hypothetical protein
MCFKVSHTQSALEQAIEYRKREENRRSLAIQVGSSGGTSIAPYASNYSIRVVTNRITRAASTNVAERE